MVGKDKEKNPKKRQMTGVERLEKLRAMCKAIDKKLETEYLSAKKKHLAAMVKLEKEMVENRTKHEEKMKKYNDNTYQYMKNKWNR